MAQEQSVEGGEDSVGRVPLNLGVLNLNDIRFIQSLLERDVDLGSLL